jgi:hypothetical protein
MGRETRSRWMAAGIGSSRSLMLFGCTRSAMDSETEAVPVSSTLAEIPGGMSI